jgi:GT2 family glycosyltransferase
MGAPEIGAIESSPGGGLSRPEIGAIESSPGGGLSRPEIAVVVPTRDRPLRLRWLLNALEEQSLAPELFEVIVCHDSRGPETEELLRTHPLALRGVLRHRALEPGTRSAGYKRNLGWRSARAPVIAFTDDDCRPPTDWLARALEAASRHPGAIVQGATRPDPDEIELALRAPHARTQAIDPPSPWAQTCNILYPRELLERLDGFDEQIESGEDTDVALRGIAAGASFLAAPEVVNYHSVQSSGLPALLRTLPRWEFIPWLVKRHPELRRECAAGVFWRETHGWMLLALAGVALTRSHPAALLLAAPWAVRAAPSYGPGPRGRLRACLELPSRAVVDLVELSVLARGSARHRSLVL